MFNLREPVNKLYSPASIGKAYLRKMGIKPFMECNPDFPKDISGYVMSAYYGGRTEVRIRNKPIAITYLDFTSMYPSVYSLLGLDKFMKAKTINYLHSKDNTNNIIKFLNSLLKDNINTENKTNNNEIKSENNNKIKNNYNENTQNKIENYINNEIKNNSYQNNEIKNNYNGNKTENIENKTNNNLLLNNLTNKETWKKPEMHSLLKIKPNNDILPIRMEYSKQSKNIGINYLTSDNGLWYTIQDVIASIILTGKIPEIIDAITFIPEGIQKRLKDVEIEDIDISAKDDFIRKVIEERMNVKKSNREDRDQIQLILKITANATSYGIYIEENSQSVDKEEDVNVYSVDNFSFRTRKIEKQGQYFNPIMATLITGSARLILAMAEHIAEDKGYFAYCDTDSIFVDPNVAKDIQQFFKPLNPYSLQVEMFKIEEDDNHKPLDNVMFYGISAKRYCLYDMDSGNITIRKYSTHGLGHLLNINGEEIWKSILTKNFKEYSDKIAASRITTSKPSILNRFKKMNSNKPYKKQIKPFNFMLIGSEKNGVIPCLPYDKNIKGIQYKPFVDYKSDTTSSNLPLPLSEYWHTLEAVLIQYIRHNDNKFDYDSEGIAHRKHIIVDGIRYIGKESNNLDDNLSGIEKPDYSEYTKDYEIVNSEEFKQWILTLKPKDVMDKGISERELKRQKAKIRKNKLLNPKVKIVKILLQLYKEIKLNKNN
jgi:hypothetical protein